MLIRYLRVKLWQRRRKIFAFYDGKRLRRLDPIEIASALQNDSEYLHRHLAESIEGDSDARKITGDAVCRAFDVKPLQDDGSGLTIAERIELLAGFESYIEALKKNIARSQTSPINSDATSERSETGSTRRTSASGSIDTERGSVPQT